MDRPVSIEGIVVIGQYRFQKVPGAKGMLICVEDGCVVAENYLRKHVDFHKRLKKMGD